MRKMSSIAIAKKMAPCFWKICGAAFLLAACDAAPLSTKNLARNQALPKFTPPNVPSFVCLDRSKTAPKANAQAKAWLDEALAIMKRPTYELTDAEKKQAEKLQQQAIEALYWPALKRKIKEHFGQGRPERALKLLDIALRSDVPEAYFEMGKYYNEGHGVEMNRVRAYAFWQKAAQLGEPRAMTELATVLSTKQNNTIGWDLVNIPVASAMLECAMTNGYGDAAVQLSVIVDRPRGPNGAFTGPPTRESTARGLAVLQKGVKLGGREAADDLSVYFNVDQQLTDCSLSGVRYYYYHFLYQMLDEQEPLLLPNLDAAVPLPPAPLPEWRNDMHQLLAVAQDPNVELHINKSTEKSIAPERSSTCR